jgi:hypothetical protein
MLTSKHLCLLSIAALSLAAVTPALAAQGGQNGIGDPGIKGAVPIDINRTGQQVVFKRLPGPPRKVGASNPGAITPETGGKNFITPETGGKNKGYSWNDKNNRHDAGIKRKTNRGFGFIKRER